jgi:hypothetical protein
MPFRKKESYEDVYKWRRHNNGPAFIVMKIKLSHMLSLEKKEPTSTP